MSEQTGINTDNIWERPGFLIRRLNQIHHALFYEAFGNDITPLQYGLLTALRDENGQDQTSLCEALGSDRTTLAGSIEQLSKKGWLKYQPSRQDRRRKIVVITLKGKRFLEASQEKMRDAQLKVLEPLEPEQQQVFISMMRTLIEGNDHHVSVPLKALKS